MRSPMSLAELEQLRVEAPTEGIGELPVIVRRKRAQDFPMVARSWLKSLRPTSPYTAVPSETFFYQHHLLIEGLWADLTCAWFLAVDPQDPDRIYGWLCAQTADSLAGPMPVVHYVYTPKAFRRFGIAARLLTTLDRNIRTTEVVLTTAHTQAGVGVATALGLAALYNPYLLWGRAAVPHPEHKYPNMRARKDPLVHSRRKLVHTLGEGGDE